ncbi:glutathione S-transferase [Crucibulum laeve]|uniref:glutathione transferase n=1 Tax=Crucibulum laeve TaxID=68775 RepID=A0A5C3M6I8_9AGAR|nr:glutathione S-transferase [Crucibulum laeve]
MILKLYGSPISTCTRRVAIVLHEKAVPFEFIEINFSKGEHKSPAFCEKQPFGQVPYIDDDGLILYESRAICRYIAANYPEKGPALLPAEKKANALFEQAASVELNNFNEFAHRAVFEMIVKPMLGGTPNKAVFDESIATLDKKLDVYDMILGKQKYLAGDQITLADLFHLPVGSRLPVAGSSILETKPNVARWWKDISSRPSWQAVKDGVVGTA